MRVTQMMLSNSSLRHINQGYRNLADVQDQLATGKKITRASQDPVVAMKGMRYRTQVLEIDQFKRNLSEAYNWMDTADSALDQGTQTLMRVRELATQAANDSYNTTERANIAKEVKQLREHLESIANTKNSNKYVFNGTDTTSSPIIGSQMDIGLDRLFGDQPVEPNAVEIVYNGKTFRQVGEVGDQKIFQDVDQPTPLLDPELTNLDEFNQKAIQLIVGDNGNQVTFRQPNTDPMSQGITEKSVRPTDAVLSYQSAVSSNNQSVEIELIKGVSIPVNIESGQVFSNALFSDLIRLERALENPDLKGTDYTGYIDDLYGHINVFVAERAELGARVNRIEMIENRMMEQEVSAKRIMSNNEDADMEDVIIKLMTQESVHRAALSAGARIMQPTLMDFLR